MIYRKLGKTGENVSAIGMGGFHLGKPPVDEAGAIRLVHAAIDRGINFMDNSWDYNEGESERRMGKALRGRRDKVFLMTKFDGRTKRTAAEQLDESLQRLQVDHVDLWQFHENNRLEDPDRFFDEGGAVEAVRASLKAGKIRYAGFTGHKHPLVHLQMLDSADEHGFAFDACQMPLSVMDAHFRSFEQAVLPALIQRDMGVLGMKSMGDGFVLKANLVTPLECLKYALRLPTSVVITGIDNERILAQACEAADTYEEMTAKDVKALLAKTEGAASTGKFEPFKTTEIFDSTAFHPEWMGSRMIS
ncbi:MAG: aldo/keto reductase [Bryobacterales bacterium]|nr:aldo/keto reductase [Bryobacterales bacterium]